MVSRPVCVLTLLLVLLLLLLEVLLFQPPLFILWLIFTKKRKIVITRRVRSTVSIDLSLYRVVPDLLHSLCVVLVLLLPPTPTIDTRIPLSFVIAESILNLIRTHLFRWLTFLLHVSVTILSIGTYGTTMYQ